MASSSSSLCNLKALRNYYIKERIGTGSQSSIFLAEEISTRIDYCIKITPKNKLCNDTEVQRIYTERDVISRIRSHPSIIQFHEFIEDDINFYLVMEYCKGGKSLLSMIMNRGKLNEFVGVMILKQLGDAIQYLHENGIAHHDLKPDNILINESTMQVKIIDFGLSAFYPVAKKNNKVSPRNSNDFSLRGINLLAEENGNVGLKLDVIFENNSGELINQSNVNNGGANSNCCNSIIKNNYINSINNKSENRTNNINEKMNNEKDEKDKKEAVMDKSKNEAILSTAFYGSLEYVAPELIERVPYNPFSADIWSLGVVIFTMLTNSLPWSTYERDTLMAEIANATFTIPDYISPKFRDLILKTMNIDPKMRITADELVSIEWLRPEQQLKLRRTSLIIPKAALIPSSGSLGLAAFHGRLSHRRSTNSSVRIPTTNKIQLAKSQESDVVIFTPKMNPAQSCQMHDLMSLL